MFEILQENNYNLTKEKQEKLKEFEELLIYYNKMFNITSITDSKEIEVKHFLDSIYGEKYFSKNSSVIEIGSGGGFPSIPLMIYREDLKFTLVESTGKKCEFLKICVDKLKLNATILNGRAEDFAKNSSYREKFDYCTARAVARLNTLLEYCIPFIKINGKFIAYKGDSQEEIKESKNALTILSCKINNLEEYNLLDYGKRNIIEIQKLKSTNIIYPRGNGKERSKPL